MPTFDLANLASILLFAATFCVCPCFTTMAAAGVARGTRAAALGRAVDSTYP
jgi:hypothetical protein